MSLDRERAPSLTESVFIKAYEERADAPSKEHIKRWLVKLAHGLLTENLPRTPSVSFDLLDERLRTEATRTDVVRSLEEDERDILLWELKQGCMTSVVNCLSTGERTAFILKNILGLDDEEASESLGVTESAYKVRLSRATKKIADYLAPRCEHVDPLNPCRCPARVGVALANGFIGSGKSVSLRKPMAFGRYGVGDESEDKPLREIQAIYSNLPDPEPAYDVCDSLLKKLEQGTLL